MGFTKMYWIKVAITIVVLVGSIYYLYPTYKLNKFTDKELEELQIKDPDQYSKLKDKEINLGLDLQGGLHLVLEVDTSKLTEEEANDAPQRALEVIRNRIDQYGVSEPSITQGEGGRIIVQLPGVKDIERAKQLLKGTAQLTFQLLTPQDKIGDFFTKVDELLTREGYTAPEDAKSEVSDSGIDKMIEGKDKTESGADSSVVASDSAAAKDDLESDALDDKPFTSRLISIGNDVGVQEKDAEWIRKIVDRPDVKALVSPGNSIIWGKPENAKAGAYQGLSVRPFYFVQDKVELTGEGMENAVVMFNDSDPRNQGKPYVQMTFNRKMQRVFADVTGEHVQERLAIILDNIVQSAPVIQERINSASSRITGNFSTDEAKDLSIVLRAGALPAPLNIMEERTVGPSLGNDSIKNGVKSTLLGGLIVIIFMIVWYRGAGVISVFALFLNIIILLGVMAALNATLTLPGIAGIILTIGMAVDANVLIYERIREEIRNNKTIRAAIDAGYARAFLTILDANVTTLITAIILFQFGTGPIKGFAITLIYGIIISMFTAIVVSRLVFDFITFKFSIKELSI